MSDQDQKEDTFDSPPQESRPEDDYPEEEPLHPGWLTLAQVLKTTDPFFEKIFFLLAYEYSCNVYLIKGDDYFSVVDPGNDYTGFMDLFRQGWCKPQDIKKIALTHGHRDQCMGAFDLLRAYPEVTEGGGFELILHKEGPQELREMVKKFGCRVTDVSGGEIIDLSGSPWEVIYTPGHTIDGLSFYHAPSKTAFTGDIVMPHAMAQVDEKAGGRLDHYLYGVKALLKKDIDHVLPGHGIPVASLGKLVVEQTYESLMLKIIGVEKEIPWIEGAKALVSKGLLEETVFCCDRELARQPDNLMAMQLKAYCLTDMGRCAESLILLDKILSRDSSNIHALTAKGHAILGMGHYLESIPFFDQALAINAEYQDAQIYKGMALYLAGRPEEAMDIELFREEFTGRIKEEFLKKSQPSSSSS